MVLLGVAPSAPDPGAERQGVADIVPEAPIPDAVVRRDAVVPRLLPDENLAARLGRAAGSVVAALDGTVVSGPAARDRLPAAVERFPAAAAWCLAAAVQSLGAARAGQTAAQSCQARRLPDVVGSERRAVPERPPQAAEPSAA